MKKYFLCLTILLSVLFCTSSAMASTLVHWALYDWYNTFGTVVTDKSTLETYSVGNVSGHPIVQVVEKVFDEGDGTAWFSWTVFNDTFTDVYGGDILSFHVPTSGLVPVDYTRPIQADEAGGTYPWEFSYDNTYFTWEADLDAPGIGAGESLDTMKVRVPYYGWTVSNAAVDYFNNDEQRVYQNGNGYWVTSHPAVPEPSSMLLLGMGILGIFGLKRKVKA